MPGSEVKRVDLLDRSQVYGAEPPYAISINGVSSNIVVLQIVLRSEGSRS
jgi:hypothetical protein